MSKREICNRTDSHWSHQTLLYELEETVSKKDCCIIQLEVAPDSSN